MIDEIKFRKMLQQLLEKSKINKVRWIEGDSEEGEELYTVLLTDNTEINIYYNSPPEALDLARASLLISGRLVIALIAEDGKGDWNLLKSLIDEARRCIFHFDEALEAIEKAFASDSIGLSREEATSDVNSFLSFVAGKWQLIWSGPMKGTEIAEIDKTGGYHTGNFHYQLEMLEYIPGKRVTFLKHFVGTKRTAERNELIISNDGRVMQGKGGPPEGLNLVYERLA